MSERKAYDEMLIDLQFQSFLASFLEKGRRHHAEVILQRHLF